MNLVVPLWFDGIPLETKILGVSLRDRIALPAKKFGFRNVILLNKNDRADEAEGDVCTFPPANLFSQPAWKKISQIKIAPGTAYIAENESFCVVAAKEFQRLLPSLEESKNFSEFIQKIKTHFKLESIPLQKKDSIAVRGIQDIPSVERWLLQGLIKDSEGFMSRHLERKISLAATRRIIDTPITPNGMTILSTLIGIAGAFFFLPSDKWFHVTGAWLFWLHSVLDGCDGEIARLKFLESRWGGILDFWGDNVVHSFVFGCIALGIYFKFNSTRSLLLGMFAVIGTMLSAGLVYWNTMRPKKESGPLFTSVVAANESAVSKVADFLARRDFIYLVILLSFFGKIQWFLWMGAVGSPIYFFVILWFHLKSKLSSEKS